MLYTIHSRLLAALLLVLLMTSAGWTVDAAPADDDAAGSLLNEEDLNQLAAEPPRETSLSDTPPLVTGSGFIGQNFISNNEAGSRAFPYGQLRPSLIGGGALTLLDRDYKVDLDGSYLSDSDNQGSLTFDFDGHYRVFLSTEALFHNNPAARYGWDTVRLSNGNVVNYDPSPAVSDLNGITVRQDKLYFRAKPTDYPFHFDLGFRRFTREGTSQLRFADVRFAAPTNNVYNRPVTVDQAIYEGTAGVDAHLGYIDIVNQFQIRHFVDYQAIPQQVLYQPQFNGATLLRNSGFLQHNENPENRYWANTLRLHTSISGGLVGALSYTYGQRQSFSDLQYTVINGAAEPKTILRNMAGDITYTPVPEFTASIKYRRQVTEYELPANIVRLPSGGGIGTGDDIPLQVPLESRLDSLTSALVYRPLSWLVLKGEFKGDFVRREGKGQSWLLQHHEDRYQGRATVVATPIKGLRLKGLYGYAATSNPLYKTTFDDKHFGELIATYNRANLFGTSASYRETRESMALSERKQRSVTTSGWVNPLPRLTLNASFAYLQANSARVIDYPIVLDTSKPTEITTYTVPGSYQASSHIYGISAIVRPIDQLDITVGYQQVRSDSVFNPGSLPNQPVASTVATYSMDGISELSRTQSVEHEVNTRIDYRITTNLSSTIEYLYRVIYDHVDSSLNGGAHQIMASVGFKW